jgi:hypothetical protein
MPTFICAIQGPRRPRRGEQARDCPRRASRGRGKKGAPDAPLPLLLAIAGPEAIG